MNFLAMLVLFQLFVLIQLLTLLNNTVPASKVKLYRFDYCHCARIDTVHELDLYQFKKKNGIKQSF